MYVSNHYNAKLKIFRSDNGGEYTSHAFKHHLAQHGILHQTSCPYTPQQNGVAERKNRHLMEVARSMMFHANVPKMFWSDAVSSACYLINRIPTKVLNDQSPFEVLNRSKPSLHHLRVFGCVSFVLVPGEMRNKLAPKSIRSMFIGYSTTQKGYKCFDPETRRVHVSREVKFIETKGFYEEKNWEGLKDLSQESDKAASLRLILEGLGINLTQAQSRHDPHDSREAVGSSHLDHEGGNEPESVVQPESVAQPADSSGSPDQDVIQSSDQEESSEAVDENETQSEGQSDGDDQYEMNEESSTHEEEELQREQPVTNLRRSTRVKKDPSNWVNTRVYYNAQAVAHPSQAVCSFAEFPSEHQAFIVCLDESFVPRSYEEAMMHKEWKDSVGDETDAMVRNDTWYESELPKGKKAVSSRWVFTIKYLQNGKIDRRKTRLVAKGYTLLERKKKRRKRLMSSRRGRTSP